MDKEKVIKGLELLANWPDGLIFPDKEKWIKPCCERAVAMLKEQETEDTGRCRIFQCKKCGFGIDDIFVTDEEKYQIVPRYCPNCGRSVK